MNQPVRTCVGCGASKPKRALVRLAVEQGCMVLDPAASKAGRGAYVCGAACAQRAVSRRAFGRAFRRKVEVEPSLLEQVQQLVGGSAG